MLPSAGWFPPTVIGGSILAGTPGITLAVALAPPSPLETRLAGYRATGFAAAEGHEAAVQVSTGYRQLMAELAENEQPGHW